MAPADPETSFTTPYLANAYLSHSCHATDELSDLQEVLHPLGFKCIAYSELP